MNKYRVRFFASAEEYMTDKCEKKCVGCFDVYETFLDFEFDTLEKALEFVKMAEKHIIKNPIKVGEYCGVYSETELEDVIWEISMSVIPKEESK